MNGAVASEQLADAGVGALRLIAHTDRPFEGGLIDRGGLEVDAHPVEQALLAAAHGRRRIGAAAIEREALHAVEKAADEGHLEELDVHASRIAKGFELPIPEGLGGREQSAVVLDDLRRGERVRPPELLVCSAAAQSEHGRKQDEKGSMKGAHGRIVPSGPGGGQSNHSRGRIRSVVRYLIAIVALGVLIALHVLGHVLMARVFGVRLKRFTFGFGPAMFTLVSGKTEWVLATVPLGGAAVLVGSNPHDEDVPENGFVRLAAWKRLLVHFAGPLANALIALVLLAALYGSGTHVPVPLTVGNVVPGSEAARATLRPGDVLETINGKPLSAWSEFVTHIAGKTGTPLKLGILREGRAETLDVVPRADGNGVGRIGVSQQYVFQAHSFSDSVVLAGQHTARLFDESGRLLLGIIARAQTNEGPMLRPLAVTRQASHAATGGLDAGIRVVVALSVLLALFNLLPLPGLDGGRILLTGFEALTRRALPAKVETLLHAAGLAGMLALILVLALGGTRARLLALMGSGNSQASEEVTGPSEDVTGPVEEGPEKP